MGLVDQIKNDVKKSGGNKRKIIYFRPDTKLRVRFLDDMDEGYEIVFHDSFQKGINTPCQEQYGRNCPHCDDDEIRTRSMYAWSVWNYEAKEVQIFLFAVNNCSPIPALMAMYETYGTLSDRDYVISKSGKGPDTTYSVVPMDKQKFRNSKAKPFSEKSLMKIIDKAFPCDEVEEDDLDDDDYDDKPKKKKVTKTKKKSMKKVDDDDDFDEEDFEDEEDEDEEEELDYEDMSAKELYKLCKERDIECKPKKKEQYYIKLLEEADEAEDDWGDDDDWENEDEE